MDAASIERRLGKSLRVMTAVIAAMLAIALITGGLSNSLEPTFVQTFFRWFFTLFIGVAPLVFIGFLFVIERLRSIAAKNLPVNSKKLIYEDPFDLPSQRMHGFKITFITGSTPTFTGLTGDLYTADDIARCALNPEHIPPVANCECGFHAFKDVRSAQHELSINPGAFLIDVDLYGVGFTYTRGFRAESQVVNSLTVPKRCMRCKIFAPRRFVSHYKLGFNSFAYLSWDYRCGMCSYNYKEAQCLTLDQMSKVLSVELR